MFKRTKKVLARYWGYLLLVVLYLGWFEFGFDPWMLAALSGLVVLYGLFRAPVPCCAPGREGLCRNNAKGLLRGCWIRQHRWQNAKMLVQRQSWAQWARSTFRSIGGNAAALGVIIGMVSAVAAIVMPIVGPLVTT